LEPLELDEEGRVEELMIYEGVAAYILIRTFFFR